MTYFFSPGWRRVSSHFRPVGKPPPPASPQAGCEHILANGFRRHLAEGLLGRRIAAVVDVFADVFRIDPPAVPQHGALLLRVEGNVALPAAALAAGRIYDKAAARPRGASCRVLATISATSSGLTAV